MFATLDRKPSVTKLLATTRQQEKKIEHLQEQKQEQRAHSEKMTAMATRTVEALSIPMLLGFVRTNRDPEKKFDIGGFPPEGLLAIGLYGSALLAWKSKAAPHLTNFGEGCLVATGMLMSQKAGEASYKKKLERQAQATTQAQQLSPAMLPALPAPQPSTAGYYLSPPKSYRTGFTENDLVNELANY